jgi:ABC-type branched-subunit amino acid transport system ATPase component
MLLGAKNLRVHYGNAEALRDVSIEVDEGTIVDVLPVSLPKSQTGCKR